MFAYPREGLSHAYEMFLSHLSKETTHYVGRRIERTLYIESKTK